MDINELIEVRKKIWDKQHSISTDIEFRNRSANLIIEDESNSLRKELFKNPELLIELFFVIVDKNQTTVPFFLNDVQRKFIETLNSDIVDYNSGKRNHLKYLVLKGRQQGFTSFISALQVAYSVCRPNFSGYTLADSANNAEDIFSDKGKFYFDNLPEAFKPTTRYNNRRELDFNNDTSTGLNSKWRVTTAGNKDAGRSKTLNFCHGSEVAFWDNPKELLVGLSEAFTKSAIIILETTANGFNYYKELWDGDNNYKNLFFEWWLTSEYVLGFESVAIKNDFIKNISKASDTEPDDVQSSNWVFARLKWLKYSKNLKDEQLYWYYNKWRDKGEGIKQEYPCTPEEAYLASGRNYFAISEVVRRIDMLKDVKPLKKGYFVYSFTNSPTTGEKLIVDNTITFIEDERAGYISFFKDVQNGRRYIISADTAGDGSDFNAAHVLDPDGYQFARIRLINDEDLYADQLYCLGKYYNDALIAVESNFSTYVNKTLRNREYPVLYTRMDNPDNITQNYTEKLGFNTNKANRPVLLGLLKELVRESIYKINDIDTLQEMLVFVINEKSRPEAMKGYHDDLIMSYGIGLYCSEQIAPAEVARDYMPTGFWTQSELEDAGFPPYIIRRYMANRR